MERCLRRRKGAAREPLPLEQEPRDSTGVTQCPWRTVWWGWGSSCGHASGARRSHPGPWESLVGLRSPGTEQAPRVKSSLGAGADLTTSSLSTQQTLLLAPRRALGSDGFPQPRGPGLHPQVTQEVCPTLSSDSWFSIFKKGQTWASSAGGGRIPRGRAANALHTAWEGRGRLGEGCSGPPHPSSGRHAFMKRLLFTRCGLRPRKRG